MKLCKVLGGNDSNLPTNFVQVIILIFCGFLKEKGLEWKVSSGLEEDMQEGCRFNMLLALTKCICLEISARVHQRLMKQFCVRRRHLKQELFFF